MPMPAILYRDAHLLAVDKPAGTLVHRSAIDRQERHSVLDALRAHIDAPLHLLHRLDRPVGGALLLALDAEAARRMGEAFERGLVRKIYLAVVRGHVLERGLIDHALREPRDPIGDARARQGKPPQSAVTQYERLCTAELPVAVGRYATARFSLVRLTPLTGRRHQLRRHLKHIAHPILGDTTHGDGRQNRFARDHLGCERLLLCARSIRFEHPYLGQTLTITAPLDAHFIGVMRRLGWDPESLPEGC
jgi:tRNA pseudouridine65 synthase